MVSDADHILIRFYILKSGFLRFFEQINTLNIRTTIMHSIINHNVSEFT